MHAFWLALFMPICFLVAWQFGGSRLNRFATLAAGVLTIGLLVWMSVVAYQGFYEAETFGDRLAHAFQTLVGSVSVPLVQLILGFSLMAIISLDFGKKAKTSLAADHAPAEAPEQVEQLA